MTVSRRTATLTLAAATAAILTSSSAPSEGAEPAASGFVYTADENGNAISRIDLRSGKVEAFPVHIAPHNVQFVPGRNLLLAVGSPASNEAGAHGSGGHSSPATLGKLIVFDTTNISSEPKIAITVGRHPAHVIADAEGKRAYVTNSGGDTMSVIDLAKGKVVTAVATGNGPHGLRMAPDGKSICVANTEDGTVSMIGAASLSETTRIKVGSAPVQVGFTPDGRRIYVSLSGENQVAVIDTATRKVIARIGVGRSPIQLYATPDGRFVYVVNQGAEDEPDDTVSVIGVAGGEVVKTIPTGSGAHGIVVSSGGGAVFVTNVFDGTVSEIMVKSQSVVHTYRVGQGRNGITYQAL